MTPTTTDLYPLTFEPVFKDYIWGGRNLADKLGREIPDGDIAEIWDIAAHPDGASTVAHGPLAGQTLAEVMEALGEQLVGSRNRDAVERNRFPLLIKLLDANRWLSVQVHPRDDYAREHEDDLGKTEMWVVLHAEPEAELIYGFEPLVTQEKVAEAVHQGPKSDAIEQYLHRVKVETGDVIFVPAGAIHALGPGIIVAEIQQNSNVTYRIYDWGRDRPIHVEQALDVLNFELIEPGPVEPHTATLGDVTVEAVGHSRYFHTERLHIPSGTVFEGNCNGETFEIWGVLEGEIELYWMEDDPENPPVDEPVRLTPVHWVLLPAGLGRYHVAAQSDSVLLRVLTP